MTPDISSQLRKLSKDESSFEKLEQIFDDLAREKEQARSQLDLLERAIRNDYEGIMITGLALEQPGPLIHYVNDALSRMTGYSREELIGSTPRILQGPKTDGEVLEELKRRLKEGQSFFAQTVNYRKDGSEFVNQWDIHPLTDSEGTVTNWVSYQHDITDRKRAEQTLVDIDTENISLRKRVMDTLQKRNRAWSRILSRADSGSKGEE